MKPIVHIHASSDKSLYNTLDRISYLNIPIVAGHCKKYIVILSGSFDTDVFEWSPDKVLTSEAPGSWRRLNLFHTHQEITEDRFNDQHEEVPPLYITHIDGEPINRGFAAPDAITHLRDHTVVLPVFYERGGKYYKCFCALFNSNYIQITGDLDRYQQARDNVGITYTA